MSTSTGVWRALLAALLFGVSTPVAKALLTGMSPQLVAGLLYLGSGAGLLLLWFGRRHRASREAPLTMTDLPWLGGAILFGGVLAPVLFMTGLARTDASSSSLLLNLEGVFTAALAWIVFRENVDRRIALGMLAIIAGGAVLSWRGAIGGGTAIGPLCIAAACLCWAVDNNLSQKVSAGDPVQITSAKGLVAGSVNLTLALSTGARLPAASIGAATLLVGFLSYGVSLVLYVRALRDLGTARTGAYFSLAPFVGAALSLLFWLEPLTPQFLVAALLMGIGVWLHLTERHEHPHTHDALAHSHQHVHDAHHEHVHSPDDPDGEPHTHWHVHEPLVHAHAHYPDIHHRHGHP